jgi:hypothetical protein
MDKIFGKIKGFFNGMHELMLSLLSVGVMVQVLFGGDVFGMDVVGNITKLIESLGSSGFVGLLAVIILVKLLDRDKS